MSKSEEAVINSATNASALTNYALNQAKNLSLLVEVVNCRVPSDFSANRRQAEANPEQNTGRLVRWLEGDRSASEGTRQLTKGSNCLDIVNLGMSEIASDDKFRIGDNFYSWQKPELGTVANFLHALNEYELEEGEHAAKEAIEEDKLFSGIEHAKMFSFYYFIPQSDDGDNSHNYIFVIVSKPEGIDKSPKDLEKYTQIVESLDKLIQCQRAKLLKR